MKIKLSQYNKRALLGGGLSAVFIGLGAYGLGNISGYEAKSLITSSLPGINALCNTIVLASATILALLLTLLSISSGTKSRLKDDHYTHVLMIAKIDTVVFVAAMVVFQLMNIPVTEAENVPNSWYTAIYYTSLGLSAVLSGGLIVVVLMLYNTVVSIIKIVGLGIDDHPLIYNEDHKDNNENEDDSED